MNINSRLTAWSAVLGGVAISESREVLTVAFWTPDIVKVTVTGELSDVESRTSPIVGNPDPGVSVAVEETPTTLVVRSEQLTVEYDLSTGTLTAFDIDGRRVARILAPEGARLTPVDVLRPLRNGDAVVTTRVGADGVKSEVTFNDREVDRSAYTAKIEFDWADGEALFGLGQHEQGHLNLRGTHEFLYQHNWKVTVPMLVSTAGYGVLVDCSSSMEFADDQRGSYLSCAVVDRLEFFLLLGPDFDAIIRSYRGLTGRPPIPPKALFGYVQSRERYVSQSQIEEVANEFAQRNIPLDVLVLDWMSWPEGQWGQKEFDSTRFPDPDAMTRHLHDAGVRFMMSIWPNFNGNGTDQQELREAGHLLANDSTYDAFSPQAREMYWTQLSQGLFRHGVDYWWTDCTEPFEADWSGPDELSAVARAELNVRTAETFLDAAVINEYSLQHVKGIYEHQRSESDRRVAILSRSSFTGQQQYGSIVWSGDISATWDVLRKQVAAGLNFTVTGQPYWTFDIGGFFTRRDPKMWFWRGDYPAGHDDPAYRELYVRWAQLGALLPVMRSHGTDTEREPWFFGEPGTKHYDALIRAINFRRALFPYLYSIAAQVTASGVSMLRMLAFDFPDSPESHSVADQFMLGPSLMVCPILEPAGPNGLSVRKVWLPPNTSWFDYWTSELHQGGQWIDVETGMDGMPLFVREGTVLPLVETDGSWTLHVYPGKDAAITLYDDDGDSYGYERNEYWRREAFWDDSASKLTLSAIAGTYPDGPSLGAVNKLTGQPIALTER